MLITAPNLVRQGRSHGFLEDLMTHANYQGRGLGRAVVSNAINHAWAVIMRGRLIAIMSSCRALALIPGHIGSISRSGSNRVCASGTLLRVRRSKGPLCWRFRNGQCELNLIKPQFVLFFVGSRHSGNPRGTA
ncbi:GNAT family N-acetyltransferase [Novosphingobium sp. TCA1]|uniref:GNAT family N-acetyltransferase n=1 Tax=Novosphingobium sp. TCA1 TaxID=2682474 RepID=UPI0035B529FB